MSCFSSYMTVNQLYLGLICCSDKTNNWKMLLLIEFVRKHNTHTILLNAVLCLITTHVFLCNNITDCSSMNLLFRSGSVQHYWNEIFYFVDHLAHKFIRLVHTETTDVKREDVLPHNCFFPPPVLSCGCLLLYFQQKEGLSWLSQKTGTHIQLLTEMCCSSVLFS